MQFKSQSFILVLVCLFSFSPNISAENAESVSETVIFSTSEKIQRELSEKQKKIVQFLKSIIKLIKPLTLALLSAGGVIVGTEYVWWRLSKYLGSENQKVILFHTKMIATTKLDELELKIARLKAHHKLNEHPYRLISAFIERARARMRSGNRTDISLKSEYNTLLNDYHVYRENSFDSLFPEIEKILAIL
jgi:hypothetical protein